MNNKTTVKEAWNNLKEKNKCFDFKGITVHPNHNKLDKHIAIKLVVAAKFQAKKYGYNKIMKFKDITIIKELNKYLKENNIKDIIKESKNPICFSYEKARFLCIEGKIKELNNGS